MEKRLTIPRSEIMTTTNETVCEECIYCGATLEYEDEKALDAPPPRSWDDAAWAELAESHRPDCEWIQTRAHAR